MKFPYFKPAIKSPLLYTSQVSLDPPIMDECVEKLSFTFDSMFICQANFTSAVVI